MKETELLVRVCLKERDHEQDAWREVYLGDNDDETALYGCVYGQGSFDFEVYRTSIEAMWRQLIKQLKDKYSKRI